MGGYMIPLEGERAPVANPYQAAMQGQEYEQQSQQNLLNQQLTQEQIQAQQTIEQQRQTELQQARQQQANQGILRQALQSIYGTQQPAAQPPVQPAAPTVPLPGNATAADYLTAGNGGASGLSQYAPLPTRPPGPVPPDAAQPQAAGPAPQTTGPQSWIERQQALVDYVATHGGTPDFVSNLQQGIYAAKENLAKLATAENAAQLAKHASQYSLLSGMFSDGKGNWQDVNPQSLGTFLQVAQQRGLLAPGDVQAITAQHPDGKIPATDVQHYANTLLLAKDFAEQGLKDAQTREAEANQQKTQIANQRAILDDASAKLATQPTWGDYQNLRADIAKVHPELAGVLPQYSDRDPETPLSADDRTSIRGLGQTAEQQGSMAILAQNAATRQAQAEGMVQARNDANDIKRYMAETQRELINFRKEQGAQTANSQAVDVRQGRTEYGQSLAQESILQRQRLNIAAAMQNQQKTGTVPQRDLQGEMDQVNNQLEELIYHKHDAAARGKVTPPIPLNQELDRIGRKPPAPPPPPTAAQAPDGLLAGGWPNPNPPAAPVVPARSTNAPAAPAPAAAPKPATPAPAAQAPPQIGQRFSNGKITVKWDGANWIDEATNKPAKF